MNGPRPASRGRRDDDEAKGRNGRVARAAKEFGGHLYQLIMDAREEPLIALVMLSHRELLPKARQTCRLFSGGKLRGARRPNILKARHLELGSSMLRVQSSLSLFGSWLSENRDRRHQRQPTKGRRRVCISSKKLERVKGNSRGGEWLAVWQQRAIVKTMLKKIKIKWASPLCPPPLLSPLRAKNRGGGLRPLPRPRMELRRLSILYSQARAAVLMGMPPIKDSR